MNSKNNINEIDFKYIKELWDCCNDHCKILLDSLINDNYAYIDERHFTQYDYNSFMRLTFYLIKIKLFNSSKFSADQLRKISMCYHEMVINFNEYKIEKIFKLTKVEIPDLFKSLNIFDSFEFICDKLFMSSDKSLNQFIGNACIVTHYYLKNGEKELNNTNNIIPTDLEEYNKLYLSAIELVTRTNFYDKILEITKNYIKNTI